MIKLDYSMLFFYVYYDNIYVLIFDDQNKRMAIVILNLLDEGELFADIADYDWRCDLSIIEAIRRAIIDQKNSNRLVTGISIGMNKDPNTTSMNDWRDQLYYYSAEWAKNVKWIKFEYWFKNDYLGIKYKGYRARFMVDGHEQRLEPPHPYIKAKNRRNRNRW